MTEPTAPLTVWLAWGDTWDNNMVIGVFQSRESAQALCEQNVRKLAEPGDDLTWKLSAGGHAEDGYGETWKLWSYRVQQRRVEP